MQLAQIKRSRHVRKWIDANGDAPFDLLVKATSVFHQMRNIESLNRRRVTVDARTMRLFNESAAAFRKAAAKHDAQSNDMERK
jgi:hypothetical protein